jgi:hypothetical protein
MIYLKSSLCDPSRTSSKTDGSLVDQQQIGYEVAFSIAFPSAAQRMVAIALRETAFRIKKHQDVLEKKIDVEAPEGSRLDLAMIAFKCRTTT